MNSIQMIELPIFKDERGSLVAIEENNDIPFTIKRIYYIYNNDKNKSRGYHAHKNLSQVAICIKGSCRFVLDNGMQRDEIVLDSPSTGLIIEGLVWREMHDFSEDCILMVLASELHSKDDYIHDYDEFLGVISHET